MSEFKKYTDFLDNDDFIQWRLTGDSSLTEYWKNFLKLHPECEEGFRLAIEQSTKIKLNKVTLPDEDKKYLQDRIVTTVGQMKAKRKTHHFVYWGVAASISLILGITYWVRFLPDHVITEPENQKIAMIVGQALKSEDICLISGTKTSSFNQNVNLHVDMNGEATVVEGNNKRSKIEIGKSTTNKLVVPFGKRSKVTLPDGTKIWLNSGSILEFPTEFSGGTRDVFLTGEMYTEVEKDPNKPFIVHTANFNIRVYGTKFNVTAYDDKQIPSSCVLVQGSVGLQSSNVSEIHMDRNEMVVCHDHQFSKTKVDVSKYISWKDGYLEFDDTPITEVLDKVGRYYNLTFQFGDKSLLAGRTCSGKIFLSDNIDNVLTTISLLSSAEYNRENQTIFITVNPKK